MCLILVLFTSLCLRLFHIQMYSCKAISLALIYLMVIDKLNGLMTTAWCIIFQYKRLSKVWWAYRAVAQLLFAGIYLLSYISLKKRLSKVWWAYRTVAQLLFAGIYFWCYISIQEVELVKDYWLVCLILVLFTSLGVRLFHIEMYSCKAISNSREVERM